MQYYSGSIKDGEQVMNLKKLGSALFLGLLMLSIGAAEIPAPVLRYTFDAPFGFKEPNAIGKGNEALIPRNTIQQEAPRREAGVFGNAIRSARRKNIVSTFPVGKKFTIYLWVFLEHKNAPHIVTVGKEIEIGVERHKARLYAKVGETRMVADIKEGEWSCIGLTSDGQDCALYLNGVPVDQKIASLTEDPKGQRLTFGGVAGAHHQFVGLIDEFRVYDQALTSEQMFNLVDKSQVLKTVPPIADAGIDHTPYLEKNTDGAMKKLWQGLTGGGKPDSQVTIPLDGRAVGEKPTAVKWSVVKAPKDAKVKIANSATLETTASFTTPGDYILELTVDSPQGKSVDTCKVVVFPPHPKHSPAKFFPNKEKPGTHITSYTNMGDEKTPAPYDAEFVKKNFPKQEPKLHLKGFAKERFKAPPPPYVHPRVFFNPEDLPAIRKRIKYDKAASSAYEKVSRMFDMMTRNETGIPVDYINEKGGFHGGAAAAYCIGAFKALNEGDSELARKLIEGAVRTADRQLEFMAKWTPKDQRNWQSKGHNILGRYATSYVYDFLYPWMTPEEQAKLRKVISKATSGVQSIGMYAVPNGTGASNWVCWVTGDLVGNILAIEGEDGFDAVTAEEAMNAMALFSRYGILPDGSSFEGMGKNSLTGHNLVAMAKRGKMAIAYQNIYNFYGNFQLHVMQPYGNQFISDDLWGSSNAVGNLEDAAVMKYAYPDDLVINFVYRNVVKGNEYKASIFKTTYRYTNPLISCWFGTEWTGPENWDAAAAKDLKGQSLDAHFNYTNIATARSAWKQDASFLYFLPRMLGGHNSPARGTFVFSALGRDWSIYPTGHNHKSTLQHSVISVDGKSVRANWARMIAYNSNKDRMIAAVDLRDYYGNRQLADKSQNYYRLKPAPEPWFNVPGWQMPHWFNGNHPGRKEAPTKTFVPAANAAYRVAAFVRETKPYAVIMDEMNIDDLPHEYRWQMVLPRALHKQVAIKGEEAIITDPKTGNFVIVRPVKSNLKFTAKYENTKLARDVIAFETNDKNWKFAVLLMAFKKGETPPATKDIPELKKTLQEMDAAIAPEKARVAKELSDQRAAVKKLLEGFTPASLGEPKAIEYPENNIKKVKGIVGKAWEFDGGEGLQVKGLPPYDKTTPFTVAFWAKAKDSKPGGSLYVNNAHRGLSIVLFQGRALKTSVDGNWYWANPPHNMAGWCHLAFTFDGKKMAYYQNGALIKEANLKNHLGGHPNGTNIGKGFKGWIDDLTIYDRGLNKEEIDKLYKFQRYGVK